MKLLQDPFPVFCPFSLQFGISIGLNLALLLHGIPVIANEVLTQLPPESGLDPGSGTNQLDEPNPLTVSELELRRLASRGGASGRSRAGSRGDCPAVEAGKPELTAIVPVVQGQLDGQAVAAVMGRTTEAYPTFWFYLPYGAENLHSVQFVINDERDLPLFDPIVVPIESQVPGFVSVQLPQSSPPLEVGQFYRWYVMLDCSPEGGSDAFVSAFVQRVELTSEDAAKLETASSLERIDLLIANDAWHEAVSELYELQMRSPNDTGIRSKWSRLLGAGGLSSNHP